MPTGYSRHLFIRTATKDIINFNLQVISNFRGKRFQERDDELLTETLVAMDDQPVHKMCREPQYFWGRLADVHILSHLQNSQLIKPIRVRQLKIIMNSVPLGQLKINKNQILRKMQHIWRKIIIQHRLTIVIKRVIQSIQTPTGRGTQTLPNIKAEKEFSFSDDIGSSPRHNTTNQCNACSSKQKAREPGPCRKIGNN